MDCRTCSNKVKVDEYIYCSVGVKDEEFEVCGNHAECPFYEEEE